MIEGEAKTRAQIIEYWRAQLARKDASAITRAYAREAIYNLVKQETLSRAEDSGDTDDGQPVTKRDQAPQA